MCSPIWRAAETDPAHSTPTTAARIAVSYPHVEACDPQASQASVHTGGIDHSWFHPALASYMHATASDLQCTEKEILWVVQCPYQLPNGEFLSSGGPATSFVSTLAFAVAHSGMVAESLLLEVEHEYLEISTGATPTSACACSALSLEQLREESLRPLAHVDTPEAPDPVLMQCMHVHMGAAGSCPLAVAVKSVAQAMLRRHNSVLPHSLWKVTCMRVLQWLQASVHSMEIQNPGAIKRLSGQVLEQRGDASNHSRDYEGHQADLPVSAAPTAQLVATQALLCETFEALHEDPVEVCCCRFLPRPPWGQTTFAPNQSRALLKHLCVVHH